mmetsp:Transcript_24509/g.62216  ORF Transcript_24509/g.62216 Transcript_24509/m.62216 type:complete len:366 (-) Transcript_24509:350-1447(-)
MHRRNIQPPLRLLRGVARQQPVVLLDDVVAHLDLKPQGLRLEVFLPNQRRRGFVHLLDAHVLHLHHIDPRHELQERAHVLVLDARRQLCMQLLSLSVVLLECLFQVVRCLFGPHHLHLDALQLFLQVVDGRRRALFSSMPALDLLGLPLADSDLGVALLDLLVLGIVCEVDEPSLHAHALLEVLHEFPLPLGALLMHGARILHSTWSRGHAAVFRHVLALAHVPALQADAAWGILGQARKLHLQIRELSLELLYDLRVLGDVVRDPHNVSHSLGLDVFGTIRVLQRVVSVLVVQMTRTHVGDHHRPAVPSERVLQESRHLGVPVRDERDRRAQRRDTIPQCEERPIDVCTFDHPQSLVVGLRRTL